MLRAYPSLGPLGPVLRTGLLAVLDPLRVEHAAQHVVAHAGKVANAAAADQHDGVLLQIVAFARDVGDDFALVRQADLGHLAKRGVRLLRRRRIDAGADAALLRVLLHRRDLGLGLLRRAALADQLVDRRHDYSLHHVEVAWKGSGGWSGSRSGHSRRGGNPWAGQSRCGEHERSTRGRGPPGYFDGRPDAFASNRKEPCALGSEGPGLNRQCSALSTRSWMNPTPDGCALSAGGGMGQGIGCDPSPS